MPFEGKGSEPSLAVVGGGRSGDVYDMLALTPPLQAYLEERFGGLDTENPELWEVYRLGLEELFDTLLRIGA